MKIGSHEPLTPVVGQTEEVKTQTTTCFIWTFLSHAHARARTYFHSISRHVSSFDNAVPSALLFCHVHTFDYYSPH